MKTVKKSVESELGQEIDLTTIEHIPRKWSSIKNVFRHHAILINVNELFLYKLCLLRFIYPKITNSLIISVDILLKPPFNLWDRLKCLIKKILFKNVDYFVLYFMDISGYIRYYGIKPEKCFYVPFKINQLDLIRYQLASYEAPESAFEGDLVMAIGRSLRDLDTFLEAMSRTGLPGAVLRQSQSVMESHGTRMREATFPPNVKPVEHDGKNFSFIQHIARARIIVIPRFSWDIKSTGISNYLMAMALGKCVVISHGPGVTELLEDGEAILVPPEDPDALAHAIMTTWHQSELRMDTAIRGQKYAFSLGDDKRLLKDILILSNQCFRTKHSKNVQL